MDDDLNAAKALGQVFDHVRELNRVLDAGQTAEATTIRGELARAGAVLGLFQTDPATWVAERRASGQAKSGLTDDAIAAAIAERAEARKRKDFKAADAIRDDLQAQGIVLVDGPEGTTWRTT